MLVYLFIRPVDTHTHTYRQTGNSLTGLRKRQHSSLRGVFTDLLLFQLVRVETVALHHAALSALPPALPASVPPPGSSSIIPPHIPLLGHLGRCGPAALCTHGAHHWAASRRPAHAHTERSSGHLRLRCLGSEHVGHKRNPAGHAGERGSRMAFR